MPYEHYDDWHDPPRPMTVNRQLWTRKDAHDFIRSYESAVSAGVNEYQWRGQTVLVSYGKYLVEYFKLQGIT